LWIFGCGGLAAIALILVIVFLVVGLNTFTTSFSNSLSNTPLRDFPAESGATANDTWTIANGQTSETLVIDDPNFLTHVETYYQSALPANGWTIQAANPSQAVNGDSWFFSRTGSSAKPGVMRFVSMGSVTEITVQYVS
jgi:hypothetical protein